MAWLAGPGSRPQRRAAGRAATGLLLAAGLAVGVPGAGSGTLSPAAPVAGGGGLLAVAVTPGQTAWAVGWAGRYPGHVVTLAGHWDGATWTRVPTPSPAGESTLDGVAAISDRNAWAVGNTLDQKHSYSLIEHWDGTAWTVVPSPAARTAWLGAVAATSARDAWAVGATGTADGGSRTMIEHWDGTAWRLVPSPSPGLEGTLTAIAAVSASDVWAVGGYHRNANDFGATLIEHWNGRAWQQVPSPSPGIGFSLYGAAASTGRDAWAVGYNSSGNQAVPGDTLIEHWNGRVWQPFPHPSAAYGILGSVTADAAGQAWAVGGTEITDSPNDQGVTMAARGGGGVWATVPSPSPGGEAGEGMLRGVAATATGGAWAVGSYLGGRGGTSQILIEHWNGTAWTRCEPGRGGIAELRRRGDLAERGC